MFVETHKSEGNVFLTLFPAFIDKIIYEKPANNTLGFRASLLTRLSLICIESSLSIDIQIIKIIMFIYLQKYIVKYSLPVQINMTSVV